jgi:tetratricopeptide (TPR) repeat protein
MSLTEWTKFAPKPRELTPPEKWNVFLSYRSVDRTWVLNLYDVLRQHGYEVFLDQCVLKPGDRLALGLEGGLESSQAGILIWSKNTRDSSWVLDEYAIMIDRSKSSPDFHFVPVTLDDSKLPGIGGTRLYINFSSYPDGPNGGELLRLFHGLVGQPLSAETAVFANQQDEASKEAAAQIDAAISIGDSGYLIELFDQGGLAWETSSALGCKAAEGLVRLGRDDEAIEMLGKIEAQFPRAIRPKQLHALAFARGGKEEGLMKAQRILARLYDKGERDPETLGILARTWMDRYQNTGNTIFLRTSRDRYLEAFEMARDDYYTGINAASKSIFLGEDEDLAIAADCAERVQKIVGTTKHANDYWQTGTVGEVFLIQRNYTEAGKLYAEAVAMAPTEEGSHTSTWIQACRLMDKLQPTDEERARIRKAFRHLPDCDAI